MKKIFLLLSMGALLFQSCDKGNVGSEVDPGAKQGKVSFVLEPGAPIVISGEKQNTKASSSVDLSAFSVEIKQGSTVVNSYSSYNSVPAELELTEGNYTLESQNDGISNGAMFDRPLYGGSTAFAVKVGTTTAVKLVCELKSTGVIVTYSDKMKSILSDIDVTVSIPSGSLKYGVDEKRTGWYSVPSDGKITIYMSAKKIGTENEYVTHSQVVSNVKAKELRSLNLDVKTTGGAGVTIEVDPKIISKDVTVLIPDSDDIIDNNGDNGSWDEDGEEPGPDPEPEPEAKAPTIVGASHEGNPFNLDEVIMIDRSDAAKENILDVLISSTATDGIQNLFLTIDSELLKPMLEGVLGITGEIDLANPAQGAAWVEMFADPMIGLIDPAVPIKGKVSHMFSVGKLMALLGSVDTAGGVEHKFHLRIVDVNGTTSKTLKVELSY